MYVMTLFASREQLNIKLQLLTFKLIVLWARMRDVIGISFPPPEGRKDG